MAAETRRFYDLWKAKAQSPTTVRFAPRALERVDESWLKIEGLFTSTLEKVLARPRTPWVWLYAALDTTTMWSLFSF